jgi:hypothetical protein
LAHFYFVGKVVIKIAIQSDNIFRRPTKTNRNERNKSITANFKAKIFIFVPQNSFMVMDNSVTIMFEVW